MFALACVRREERKEKAVESKGNHCKADLGTVTSAHTPFFCSVVSVLAQTLTTTVLYNRRLSLSVTVTTVALYHSLRSGVSNCFVSKRVYLNLAFSAAALSLCSCSASYYLQGATVSNIQPGTVLADVLEQLRLTRGCNPAAEGM